MFVLFAVIYSPLQRNKKRLNIIDPFETARYFSSHLLRLSSTRTIANKYASTRNARDKSRLDPPPGMERIG